MINVTGVYVISFFDTRASHSFISHDACRGLDLSLEPADNTLLINTTDEIRIYARHVI